MPQMMLHRNKPADCLRLPKRRRAMVPDTLAHRLRMSPWPPSIRHFPRCRKTSRPRTDRALAGARLRCVPRGCAFERVWLIDSLGRIIDNDFIGVWAAGRLVLDGHPAAAYDWGLHRKVEVAVAGRDFASYYGWHCAESRSGVADIRTKIPYPSIAAAQHKRRGSSARSALGRS
jgi:hypothetical protein